MAPEGGGSGGAGPASAPPLVKTEEPEDGKPAAPPPAAAAKAEDEQEEVDYGGDAPAPPKPEAPLRAMPDYGDLVDGDGDEGVAKIEPAATGGVRASPVSGAAARADALFIGAVQRLTRTHLDEVFTAKGLRSFVQVDWIADDQVIVEFASAKDAAAALSGVRAGFDDVELEDDAPPGPGLWRAQRGMLEFRQATAADTPAPGFQRKHRAGKQVREFRFWEAIKDSDRRVLEHEEPAVGDKRPMSSGEDCIAAAMWGDPEDLPPPPKRRRRREATDTDDDGADLLKMMALQDKSILVKEEQRGEVPQVNETSLVNVRFEDEEAAKWEEDSWWERDGGGKWGRGGWREDDSWWSGSWGSGRGGRSRGWKRGDGEEADDWQAAANGGAKRRRKGEKGGGKGGGAEAGGRGAPRLDRALDEARGTSGGSELKLDDEEKARRQRRAARFSGPGGAGGDARPAEPAAAAAGQAAGAPLSAKEEATAPA